MASGALFNPLSPADYKRIREALAEVEKVQPYLDALGTMGHQVEGHQQSLAAAKQYLDMVLDKFPEASAS